MTDEFPAYWYLMASRVEWLLDQYELRERMLPSWSWHFSALAEF